LSQANVQAPPAFQALAGRTVLYLVTEDWYFLSHRLDLARAARDAGASVVVVTRVGKDGPKIEAEGFQLHPLNIRRSSLNPLRDLITLTAIRRIYRKVKPDLVHHVSMKPMLYGSIAAKRAGVPAVVNAATGMGFLFISQGLVGRVLRPLLKSTFHGQFNRPNSKLIVQNPDDRQMFIEDVKVEPDRIAVIRGSGVDVQAFRPVPEPEGTPVAICVSRMLRDKGIEELVDAAGLLKKRGVPLRVRLVGPTDDNPASISPRRLEEWANEGVVDVAGPSDDVAGEYARAHIAVLPSYREGLPKSLLEAAACGRPMVATDVPGCREICRTDETGLLVPARSVEPLADALEKLARDGDLRRRFGAAARRAAETEFASELITGQTIALYEEMLSGLACKS